MKAFVISRKMKLLSKIFICFFVCSIFMIYFQNDGGGEKGEIIARGEQRELFEDSHMKLMLTVLVLPKDQMESAVRMINSTWGLEALGHYRLVTVGAASVEKENLSHVLQATECSGSVPEDPRQLFCLLKTIYYSHINEYKWFLLASDLIYPSVQKLERNLPGLNSHAFIHMGELAHDHTLVHDYCSMRAGLLLSRKALQTIVQELEGCLLSGGPGEASDAVLGWCMTTVLHKTCWEITEVFNEPARSELYNRLVFDSIQDREEMDDIHSFTQAQEVNYHFEKMKQLCHSTKSNICDSVFKKHVHSGHTSDTNEKAKIHKRFSSEHKMAPWEMLRDFTLFSSHNQAPSQPLRGAKSTELLYIRAQALHAVRDMHGTPFALLRVLDYYTRYRSKVGHEYIVDMLLQDVMTHEVVQKRVSLVRPDNTKVIMVEDSPPEVLQKQINFVVPAHNVVTRLKAFLKTYETACLEEDGNCKLHIVMYDSKEIETIREEIKQIELRYPHFESNIIEGVGTFNRGTARDLGMSALKDDDLAFMCDVDIDVDKTFLNRCRQNALQGERVYFPTVFKYYNMDFVHPGEERKPFYSFTEQHGYWCIYGYGNICTYKSDYSMIGGFNLGFEGWGGEDTEIAEKALRKSIEIFRAPDPGLVHQFHFNNCSGLSETKKQFCVGSRNKGLASKVQLADYVYRIKYGM